MRRSDVGRIPLLASLLLGAAATAASAAESVPSLQLRWELRGDSFPEGSWGGTSHVAVTLTNRGRTPLPAQGWAIYWSAVHQPTPGSVRGGVTIDEVVGDLQRLSPTGSFAGLAPGQSAVFEYDTSLLPNRTFAPANPYLVLAGAPAESHPLDYLAAPIRRAAGLAKGPLVVSPAAQFERDSRAVDIPKEALPPVFPTPREVTKTAGGLTFKALPEVIAPAALNNEAAHARELVKTFFPGATPVSAKGAPAVRLEIGRVDGLTSPEGYELVVSADEGVKIRGASPAGVFYGLQSLRALLPSPPGLRIVDEPRFGYRGLMLDVSRNFQPKAEVLRVLDLMARFKLNTFHFHLTEDEGWRVEIDGLPELTGHGSRRGHTAEPGPFLPPAFGSGGRVDRPYGSGYYTKADYAEILRFAAARHIEVIPEIEMPGHARAAIKAMEARYRKLQAAGDLEGAKRYLLSDAEDASVYTSAQRYHDNVMNPALPSTYAFIEKVVGEMVALHREAGVPLRNLHVGGDEVPAGVWERSKAANAYRTEDGLRSVDEFWFVFYGRVEKILNAHGLKPSGWEEIGLRKQRENGRDRLVPNPDFASRGFRAYVWNNLPGSGAEDLAYRMANAGYPVVLSPVTHMYLDLAYNPNPEEPGLNWGGYVDLEKPFSFIPFDYFRSMRVDGLGRPLDPKVFVGKEALTPAGRANILGLQANLWAETLGGEGRLDFMLMPKLLGLAERAWAPEPAWAKEKDDAKAAALYASAWSEYVNVLGKKILPALDAEPRPWRYRIPTPGLKREGDRVRGSVEIPGFTVRYTVDGTEPGTGSPVLQGAVAVPKGATVRAAAFDRQGRHGHVAEALP